MMARGGDAKSPRDAVRSSREAQQQIEHDPYDVENWSFLLDLTIATVLEATQRASNRCGRHAARDLQTLALQVHHRTALRFAS
jgi:hypothetical protein